MNAQDNQNLVFENVWRKDVSHISAQVLEIWKNHKGPVGDYANQRLNQLVFVVKDAGGNVVGMSTAFKTYIKQLRNHFFAMRLMLIPENRIPGLTSKLLVSTRDYFESIHQDETTDPAIGLITLVENQRLKESRNEAIWPASKMVYIGSSKEGNHIRVYYFKGARILP
ncbi:MAG: hypothetical protein WD824_19580 [Cyclobacteriaceae bacterium]